MGTPSLEDQQHMPEGLGNLIPTGVRVGAHDGFTRVVIDLEGEGEPGWFTSYTDSPAQQASGKPVEVKGNTFLNLGIEGTPWPSTPELKEKYMQPGTTPGAGVVSAVNYITALQLDTKLDGIPSKVLAQALEQARDARSTILETMAEVIDTPDEMSGLAPKITSVQITVNKIGELIGPKGKTINQITEETGADVSIEDDGTVYVSAATGEAADAAIDKVNSIANPQLPKVGERFLGTVVKTVPFGAFVSLTPGRDGLIHISNLGGDERIEKVEDVINVGDKVQVEIADIDNRGKISLVPVED